MKLSYEKAARKMLVKLTLGGNTLEGPHTLKPELTTTSQ
jgi:hypothetical protein